MISYQNLSYCDVNVIAFKKKLKAIRKINMTIFNNLNRKSLTSCPKDIYIT